MANLTSPLGASPHTRVAAATLAIGALANLGLRLGGPMLAPLNYAAWLVVGFGAWSFGEAMGLARPLNRAGMLLFAAAFCAATVALLAADPATLVRAQRLYAFAVLGALIFWSVAMMHRRSAVRTTGLVGASVGAGAIGLLVVAHVLLGTATVFGFSQLFSDQPGGAPTSALAAIDGLLALWSLAAAALMWTGRLLPGSPGSEEQPLTVSARRPPPPPSFHPRAKRP